MMHQVANALFVLSIGASQGASSGCVDPSSTPLECIKQEIYGDGVLMHNLGSGKDLMKDQPLDGSKDHITDCADGIKDCSAWSFYQNGLVPMVYNYPNAKSKNQHQVGLMIKSGPMWDKVTRMHVIDGITLGRGPGGVVGGQDADYWKQNCPDWSKAVMQTPMVCTSNTAPDPYDQSTWPSKCNVDEGRFEVPLSPDGSDWVKIFMHNTDQSPLVERFNTNMRQCEFQKEDFELWRSALVHMYDEMQNQIQDNHASGSSYPQVWATKLPDAQEDQDNDYALYLENEINFETAGAELLSMIKSRGTLLAVMVQVNKCKDQLRWLDTQHGINSEIQTAEDVCSQVYDPNDDSEDQQIEDSKQAACQLADQLTNEGYLGGKRVPVIAATLTTNSVPAVDEWADHRADKFQQELFMPIDCSSIMTPTIFP